MAAGSIELVYLLAFTVKSKPNVAKRTSVPVPWILWVGKDYQKKNQVTVSQALPKSRFQHFVEAQKEVKEMQDELRQVGTFTNIERSEIGMFEKHLIS